VAKLVARLLATTDIPQKLKKSDLQKAKKWPTYSRPLKNKNKLWKHAGKSHLKMKYGNTMDFYLSIVSLFSPTPAYMLGLSRF
jgi:hypothetical protein